MIRDKDYTFDIEDFSQGGIEDCIELLRLYCEYGAVDGFLDEGVRLAHMGCAVGVLMNSQGQALMLGDGNGAERLVLCQPENKELDFS